MCRGKAKQHRAERNMRASRVKNEVKVVLLFFVAVLLLGLLLLYCFVKWSVSCFFVV